MITLTCGGSWHYFCFCLFICRNLRTSFIVLGVDTNLHKLQTCSFTIVMFVVASSVISDCQVKECNDGGALHNKRWHLWHHAVLLVIIGPLECFDCHHLLYCLESFSIIIPLLNGMHFFFHPNRLNQQLMDVNQSHSLNGLPGELRITISYFKRHWLSSQLVFHVPFTYAKTLVTSTVHTLTYTAIQI